MRVQDDLAFGICDALGISREGLRGIDLKIQWDSVPELTVYRVIVAPDEIAKIKRVFEDYEVKQA